MKCILCGDEFYKEGDIEFYGEGDICDECRKEIVMHLDCGVQTKPCHLCCHCKARVSDEFYDKDTGLCDQCLRRIDLDYED